VRWLWRRFVLLLRARFHVWSSHRHVGIVLAPLPLWHRSVWLPSRPHPMSPSNVRIRPPGAGFGGVNSQPCEDSVSANERVFVRRCHPKWTRCWEPLCRILGPEIIQPRLWLGCGYEPHLWEGGVVISRAFGCAVVGSEPCERVGRMAGHLVGEWPKELEAAQLGVVVWSYTIGSESLELNLDLAHTWDTPQHDCSALHFLSILRLYPYSPFFLVARVSLYCSVASLPIDGSLARR
jgi:hypothetical protein